MTFSNPGRPRWRMPPIHRVLSNCGREKTFTRLAWLKSMMLQPQKYDNTWVPDRVHAQSALIYLNSKASPEFAWNDDPQPVRLAT
ncbi:hypothetical protein E4U59_004019 [Claviceps monticola]|nr:hypothetical protein E4U59_004019 [Claviceps monticola]